MPESYNRELPRSSNEGLPVRMTKDEFDLISGNDFESKESLEVLERLGISISDSANLEFVKVSIDGEIKLMRINRDDFGTIHQFTN